MQKTKKKIPNNWAVAAEWSQILDQINNFMEVERTRVLWHLITVFLIKFKSGRGIQIPLLSGKYPTNQTTLMLCLSFSNVSATLSCLECALIQLNFHSLVKIFSIKYHPSPSKCFWAYYGIITQLMASASFLSYLVQEPNHQN